MERILQKMLSSEIKNFKIVKQHFQIGKLYKIPGTSLPVFYSALFTF